MRLIQKTHTYSRILSPPPPPSPLYPFSALICLNKNNNKTILTAVQTSTFVQSYTIHRHSCSGGGSRMNASICTYCILITVQRRGREWMRARTTKAWLNSINIKKKTHTNTLVRFGPYWRPTGNVYARTNYSIFMWYSLRLI